MDRFQPVCAVPTLAHVLYRIVIGSKLYRKYYRVCKRMEIVFFFLEFVVATLDRCVVCCGYTDY